MSEKFESLIGADSEELNFIFMRGLKEAGSLEKGVVLAEGRYIGSFTSKTSKIYHKFKAEDGTINVLTNYSSLKKQIDKLKVNDYVQVLFDGFYTYTKGPAMGKETYSFKILRAKDM